jgi:hypothetical protein
VSWLQAPNVFVVNQGGGPSLGGHTQQPELPGPEAELRTDERGLTPSGSQCQAGPQAPATLTLAPATLTDFMPAQLCSRQLTAWTAS